jgi:hypothetical protein
MRICVQSSPGNQGEILPRSLQLGGRRVPVVAILQTWQETAHRCYQVRDIDGRRFVLRYQPESRSWELTAVYGRSA